jgi:hypothetical protein
MALDTAIGVNLDSELGSGLVSAMRASDEISDEAFHQVEKQLDWMEMAGGRREERSR